MSFLRGLAQDLAGGSVNEWIINNNHVLHQPMMPYGAPPGVYSYPGPMSVPNTVMPPPFNPHFRPADYPAPQQQQSMAATWEQQADRSTRDVQRSVSEPAVIEPSTSLPVQQQAKAAIASSSVEAAPRVLPVTPTSTAPRARQSSVTSAVSVHASALEAGEVRVYVASRRSGRFLRVRRDGVLDAQGSRNQAAAFAMWTSRWLSYGIRA